MNSIVLMGRLTQDPQLAVSQITGMPFCRFTLAVDRPLDKNGNKQTDFIDCTAFDKRADTISKYVKKGSRFLIRGSLQIDTFIGRDGTKRTKPNIIVFDFDFCGDSSPGNNGLLQKQNQTRMQGFMEDIDTDAEDDIPF